MTGFTGSWEEVQRVLNVLPVDATMSEHRWLQVSTQSLWDWACQQRHPLYVGPHTPWLRFADGQPLGRLRTHLGVWSTQFWTAAVSAGDVEILCQLDGLKQQRDYWHAQINQLVTVPPDIARSLGVSQVLLFANFECVQMLVAMADAVRPDADSQWVDEDER